MQKLKQGLSLRNMVLLIWIATFAYLILDDNYTLFIRPDFGFLIYTGFFISTLFFISSFFSKQKQSSDGGFGRALIILLPVVFIFITGDHTLSSFALSKRTLMAPVPAADTPGSAEMSETERPSDQPIDTTLSELLRKWKSFSGKTVTLQGLLHATLEDNDTYALVFKYFITCCVADAVPVGIFVKKEKLQGFSDDDWVEVTGSVDLMKLKGYDVILMTLDTIKKVDKPSKGSAYMFF